MTRQNNSLLVDPGNSEVGELIATRLDLDVTSNQSIAELWNTEASGFQGSQIFESLTSSQKYIALSFVATKRLQLALTIEEMGLIYCAKMNLLSQSREERIAFSLMGADEARHFEMLRLISPADELPRNSTLQELVTNTVASVEASDRIGCLFALQVLLEGFGLSYYRSLALTTTSIAVKAVFNEIVADEAFHHGLGIVLFNQEVRRKSLTSDPASLSLCEQLLRAIAGDVWIAEAIEAATASTLSKSDRKNLITETGWELASRGRMNAIANLVRRHAPEKWTQDLERRHAFDV